MDIVDYSLLTNIVSAKWGQLQIQMALQQFQADQRERAHVGDLVGTAPFERELGLSRLHCLGPRFDADRFCASQTPALIDFG